MGPLWAWLRAVSLLFPGLQQQTTCAHLTLNKAWVRARLGSCHQRLETHLSYWCYGLGGFHPKNYEMALSIRLSVDFSLYLPTYLYLPFFYRVFEATRQKENSLLRKIPVPLIWMSLKLIVVIATEDTFFIQHSYTHVKQRDVLRYVYSTPLYDCMSGSGNENSHPGQASRVPRAPGLLCL